MRPNDVDLSSFEHSRTPNRIGAGIVFVLGILVCLAIIDPGGGPSHRARTLGGLDPMVSIVLPITAFLTVLFTAMLLTLRKCVTVDFDEGLVAAESRMLGFSRRKELPISSDGRVVHREKSVSTGEGEQSVWVLEYACADGSLEMCRQPDAIKGRAFGERLAQDLDLPLVEMVEGVFATRAAKDLDRCVVDQGLAEDLKWPARRVSDRFRWEHKSEGGVEITIGPPGFCGETVQGALLVLVSLTPIIGFVFYLPGSWHLVSVIGTLVLTAAMACTLGVYGASLILGSLVWVQRWSVDRHGLGFAKDLSSRLPASLIEQVVAGDNGILSVRADEGVHVLGGGLEVKEVESLRRVVLLALTGGT